MNKRHYEHTLPNIRGSLSNTYVLVQFSVEFTEHGYVAVDVRFHHVHEDVVHLVVSALLRYRFAASLCHVGRG